MWLYTLLKTIAFIPFHLVFLFRVKYVGKKNFLKKGPMIICCNHITLVDPVFIICACFRRRIRFMAKAEIFKNGFLKWFFKSVGVFPVKRGEADIDAVKTSLRILKDGGALGIFPEGTRQKDGIRVDEAHAGIVMFAAKTKTPIVPCTITGSKGKVRAFHKVVLNIGEPIYPDDLGLKSMTNDEYKRAAKEIMDKIYDVKSRIDGQN